MARFVPIFETEAEHFVNFLFGTEKGTFDTAHQLSAD